MMRSRTALLAVLLLVALVADAQPTGKRASASLSPSAAAALNDARIRCKVCERAIEFVWHQGVQLRDLCNDHASDPRCDRYHLHRYGIEEMVSDVCKKLPETHKLLNHEDEATGPFDLVRHHEDPQHPQEVNDAVRYACTKWLHDEHTIEEIGKYMFANLDAKKPTGVILPALVEMFCSYTACNPSYVRRRRNYHDELG